MLSFTFRLVGSSMMSRVRQEAGEPVEFGDDQSVAVPHGGESLPQAGPLPVPSGQPVIGVDGTSGPPSWGSHSTGQSGPTH
jgi:hypothetical protein